MLTCVVAGVALACTPVLVWRLTTGTWVCLDPETFYYLQIAAQAFYNHPWYISDPVTAGGVTFYPWLPFVPVVFIARNLGLSIFSVALIWLLLAGVGIGAMLYLVFRQYLRRPWIAAGLTIVCMSEPAFCNGFNGPLVLVFQLRRLLSALFIHPSGPLQLSPVMLWRTPDPALDLPFLFLQIIAVASARRRPQRLNLYLSAGAFGLLFYVFFYLWTIVATALFIAFLLDSAGRKVYRWTALGGLAIGLPNLVLTLHARAMVSAEAISRFGFFVRTSRTTNLDYHLLTVAIVILIAIWIRKTGRFDLIYMLGLLIAGMLLGDSRLITGIHFHEYHFEWLWWPIRLILVLIVLATLVQSRISRRSWYGLAFASFTMLYFICAIYLNAIEVTRTRFGIRQREDFLRYRSQRMTPGVVSLIPQSVLAGSEYFGELAGVAENQRQLYGWSVPISVSLDNADWQSRGALNAYLMGVGRADFIRQTEDQLSLSWFFDPIRSQLIEGFTRQFDAVTRDPDHFVHVLDVRYVALPADQPPPAYVKSCFRILQPGPYWQIWQLEPRAAIQGKQEPGARCLWVGPPDISSTDAASRDSVPKRKATAPHCQMAPSRASIPQCYS
jgi:hypothetical protein